MRTLSGQILNAQWSPGQTTCPQCGRPAWRVPQSITLLYHVHEKFWPRVKPDVGTRKGFRFCPHLQCPVVYIHPEGEWLITVDEVRTRIGYKVNEDPIPVCYCIGVLAETIRHEILVRRCCDSLKDIQKYTGARTGKWCHVTNPSGRCCGPLVQRVIEAALRERVDVKTAEIVRTTAAAIPGNGDGEPSVQDACCTL